MGTTSIRSYLVRKELLLLNGMAAPLRGEGVMKLHELCREVETQICRPKVSFFPIIKVIPQFFIRGFSSNKPLIVRINLLVRSTEAR